MFLTEIPPRITGRTNEIESTLESSFVYINYKNDFLCTGYVYSKKEVIVLGMYVWDHSKNDIEVVTSDNIGHPVSKILKKNMELAIILVSIFIEK